MLDGLCFSEGDLKKYKKEPQWHRTHGESRPIETFEYRVWRNMRNRCRKTWPYRQNYFDRGIRVCARWQRSYEAFLADVGRSPSRKHSLDRINNDKGYSPGNVRWATKIEQDSNRTTNRHITFRGETRTLTEWSQYLKLGGSNTLARRLKSWPIELAMTMPALPRKFRGPFSKLARAEKEREQTP